MITLKATIEAQREAADPRLSAFVAANAGAGKTHVLTQRVARLLLGGSAPEKILCITYTKAAAAEMAERLFKLLGEWALAEDGVIADAVAAMTGADASYAMDFGQARRLFARALETPGGLKILTIHAFCENVLKRFPLEAGVAPGFAVLTDDEARALADSALDEAIVGGAAAASLNRLAALRAPDDLRNLLLSGLLSRRALERLPALQSRRAAFARSLRIDPQTDEASALAALADVVATSDMERAQAALRLGGKNARDRADGPIAKFLAATATADRAAALDELFRKSDGAVREAFADAQIKRQDSWVEPFLAKRALAYVAARDAWRAAVALEDTLAYVDVLSAALAAYEAKKAAAAALDFDDLIARTNRLMATTDEGAWILYKLDQGVDHILLDEAQDTSPAQWSLLERLLAEMTAGEGARGGGRTFFAVGDQKQSIYAFQGADAALFDQKRADLGKKLEAVSQFRQPELAFSFRSTAPVLGFVDAVFADPAARRGLVALDADVAHGIERAGHAGRIEIWPLEPRTGKTEQRPWDAPVDSLSADDPARRLSERVAAEITQWLLRGERLLSSDRPIAPGDILILVQARNALFHEMIRALSARAIPVAGADRIRMLAEAAVEDLLAYARAALDEEDDLSLAEVLKSPFFNWSEDALFHLAHGRAGRLWSALERDASAGDVRAEFGLARRIGRRDGAFAFFTHVLETGAPSGRRRLYARLGAASRDAVEELLRQALEYEARRPRSLGGFLDWFSAAAGEVKREMSEAGSSVRVMTVHGAKGLEAPIVFLLDAHRTPNDKPTSPLLDLARDPARASAPLFGFTRIKDDDCAALAAARARRKALEYEEYRRKLYVAATRARDRLYVCGVESGKGDPSNKSAEDSSWHALSLAAMARLDGAVRQETEPGLARWIYAVPQSVPPQRKDTPPPSPPTVVPAFLREAARRETPIRRVQPSSLAAEDADDGAAFSPTRREEAFRRGRSIHRLLELLPEIAPQDRAAAGERLLARLAPEISEVVRAGWGSEVLAILSDSAFAEVFSGRAKAEAAIAGRIDTPSGPALVNGAVDRLVVLENRVLIVDYKTNRPPPARVEDAPTSYLAQLAAYRALLQQIYPGHEISCALLWTYAPRLMPVPAPYLDHALKSALSGRFRALNAGG